MEVPKPWLWYQTLVIAAKPFSQEPNPGHLNQNPEQPQNTLVFPRRLSAPAVVEIMEASHMPNASQRMWITHQRLSNTHSSSSTGAVPGTRCRLLAKQQSLHYQGSHCWHQDASHGSPCPIIHQSTTTGSRLQVHHWIMLGGIKEDVMEGPFHCCHRTRHSEVALAHPDPEPRPHHQLPHEITLIFFDS
jgi:hypothetical protein